MWGKGPTGSNAVCSALCLFLLPPAALHQLLEQGLWWSMRSTLITRVLNSVSDRLAISSSLSCILSGALICSFIWAIFILSQCTCYIVRGGALGICQGGAAHVALLWCCMWNRGQRGDNSIFSALCWLSVTSPTTYKQIGPFLR